MTTRSSKTGRVVVFFETRAMAWGFMRRMDAIGVMAGYPSLTDNDGRGYSVEYVEAAQ